MEFDLDRNHRCKQVVAEVEDVVNIHLVFALELEDLVRTLLAHSGAQRRDCVVLAQLEASKDASTSLEKQAGLVLVERMD